MMGDYRYMPMGVPEDRTQEWRELAMQHENEVYLGDGVYAREAGYHIVLRVEDTVIYLDDHVQTALIRFIKTLRGIEDDE